MKGIIEAFGNSAVDLRDILFPRRCCVCKDPLCTDEKDICTACLEDLPLTYFWDWAQNPAFERLVRHAPVEAAASLFFFREEAGYSHILHSIKYAGRKELGLYMGRMLGERLASSSCFAEIDAVVPVPLHPLRKWSRGYNQAEIIASAVAEAMGKPLRADLLYRKRRTRTQTKLHGQAKRSNVSGAFALRRLPEPLFSGTGSKPHILLIDDVLTTGSTLAECANTIMPHCKVSAASLAFVG